MTGGGLPFRTVAEITPDRVCVLLRGLGLLADARVVGLRTEPIGTGQMADSIRIQLAYDAPGAGPSSLVAKLASSDETSRSTGRALRAYEVEVGFYRDVAGTVDVRVPRCHYAAIDLDTHDFALLLEDLAPARQGDQLEGCDPDLAARVLEQAVAFHAPRWGDPTLEQLRWLNRSTDGGARIAGLIRSLYPAFLERFGTRLDDDVLRGLDAGMAHIEEWWAGFGGARTLMHGDLRLDNLLLGNGPDDLWVVDWQTVILGNGVADVSYFVGGNLLPDVRRPVESDLLREYFERMQARGVTDLSWDECWARYRHGSWHGVFLTVGASMLVAQTERGDRMFVTDLDRHVRHALDLDAVSTIGAAP